MYRLGSYNEAPYLLFLVASQLDPDMNHLWKMASCSCPLCLCTCTVSARTNFLRTLLITRARRPATVRLDRSHPDARQETYTWRHPHGRSARGVRAWEPATATRRGAAYASPETSGPPATRGPPAWPLSPSLLSRAPSARLARPHVTGGSARPPVAFARQIRSADEVPPRRPIPFYSVLVAVACGF